MKYNWYKSFINGPIYGDLELFIQNSVCLQKIKLRENCDIYERPQFMSKKN